VVGVAIALISACTDHATIEGTSGTEAAAPATLTTAKLEGDGQTAAVATPVAVAPAVRLTDARGAAVAGLAVTFAVTAGGGRVTGASVASDADGVARVGGWTLGDAPGVNTLVASVSGTPPVTFTATATPASPDVAIAITAPAPGLVGDTVLVRATTTSRYQLASVTATIAGRTIPLTAVRPSVWEGIVSLVGAPRDTTVLVARAVDIDGVAATAARTLVHDRKPRAIVASPVENSVARPTVVLDVACDDDDPAGCTLAVRRDGALVVGPTPAPIHATLSLADAEGTRTALQIEARDARNQLTTVTRTVWVESSPRLQLLGAGDGEARDVRDTRLLLTVDSLAVIRHLDRGGADSIRVSGSVSRAFLTPNGAALSTSLATAPYALLFVRRDGVLTSRALNSATSLAARGNYVIYTVPPLGWGPLFRLDVVSGAEVRVADVAGNGENDVAENGDVAYWVPYDIVRYRGASERITADDASLRWSTYPVTDGINVVFRRQPPCCTSPTPMEIWLSDGTALTRLASHGDAVSPGVDYAVAGGWTAYTAPDRSLVRQVWTRSPAGVQRAVSAFGTSSMIRAIAPDGRVVFDAGRDRYLAGPSGAPARIGSSLGVVQWRDGRFVVLLGNAAFAVIP
jgi:hypothetical protein